MTYLSRALPLIPSATQTFSKSRAQWPENAPEAIVHGHGSHVWATDGREFVDCTLALGPIVLGYADKEVDDHVIKAIQDGPIFSMPHPVEATVAQMLVDLIPSGKDGMVKFGLSGSDATSAAVRCARAYTGRDTVLSVGYHGWHSEFCPNRDGVPEPIGDPITTLRVADWDSWALQLCSERIAAIIVEPEYTRDLIGLRKYCSAHGIVLVFDEVLSGFRVALGGYQEHARITPDLTCLSKAMGNGYAVSAVVGKREIMRTFERIGYSGTFFGETVGLAAAGATIAKLIAEPVIPKLWNIGKTWRTAFDDAAKHRGIEAELRGLPPRMTVHFAGDRDGDPILGPSYVPWRTLWAQHMIQRGVLANFGLTACYAHAGLDTERVAQAIQDTFAVMTEPGDQLIGEVAQRNLRAA